MSVVAGEGVSSAVSRVRVVIADLMSSAREMIVLELDGTHRVCTRLQGLHRVKFAAPEENVVFRVMLHHAFSSELRAPGTFDACMAAIVRGDVDLAVRTTISFAPSMRDIRGLIDGCLKGTACASMVQMVFDALELAGLNGRIVVERTPSKQHLERVEACCFDLRPVVKLPNKLNFSECRVICIDGHIETVAQAHAVFQQLTDSGEPCALFVRELSDEVKHTIKVNFDRGCMRIVPFIVTFDIEGINTLVDVATAAGGDVVSREKGELISSLVVSDHPIVDRFEHDGTMAMISNRGSRASVKLHAERLRSKMSESRDEVSSLLERRLRALAGGDVRFRIVDDDDFALKSQLIDFAFRIVKCALSFGVQHGDDGTPCLAMARPSVQHFSSTCLKMLMDTSAIIA